MRIREARPSDAPACYAIPADYEAVDELVVGATETVDAFDFRLSRVALHQPRSRDYRDEEQLDDFVEDFLGRAKIVVAEDEENGNKIVGYVAASVWERNNLAYIGDLAVDRPCRNSGIGRALVERIVEWARAEGRRGVLLETQGDNPAIDFYLRIGFTIAGFNRALYGAGGAEPPRLAVFLYRPTRNGGALG